MRKKNLDRKLKFAFNEFFLHQNDMHTQNTKYNRPVINVNNSSQLLINLFKHLITIVTDTKKKTEMRKKNYIEKFESKA